MVVTTILACACVGGQAYESQISISTYIIYFDKITTLFFVMQGLESRPQSDDLPLERTMTIAWIYTQIPYTTLAAILCISLYDVRWPESCGSIVYSRIKYTQT